MSKDKGQSYATVATDIILTGTCFVHHHLEPRARPAFCAGLRLGSDVHPLSYNRRGTAAAAPMRARHFAHALGLAGPPQWVAPLPLHDRHLELVLPWAFEMRVERETPRGIYWTERALNDSKRSKFHALTSSSGGSASVSCGPPVRTDLNFSACASHDYLGTCTVSCLAGFVGSPSAECTGNGMWFYTGDCVPDCPPDQVRVDIVTHLYADEISWIITEKDETQVLARAHRPHAHASHAKTGPTRTGSRTAHWHGVGVHGWCPCFLLRGLW